MMSGPASPPSNSDKLMEPPSQPSQSGTPNRPPCVGAPSTKHAEYSPKNTEQLASNPTGGTFLEHRRQTSEAPFLQEEAPLPSSA
jgi:hypothetical protein